MRYVRIVAATVISSVLLFISLSYAQKPAPEGNRQLQVPFVGCPSDGQAGYLDPPRQEPQTVTVEQVSAGEIAYYKGVMAPGAFGPGGWHCHVWYGSGGGLLLCVSSVSVVSSGNLQLWHSTAVLGQCYGVFLLVALTSLLPAQSVSQPKVPRFEDYPVAEKWEGPAAPVKLTTASERLFVTRLTAASKEPPDFAGHYRFAGWGCGSICAAGAIIDLTTGIVYAPPFAGKGTGAEHWIFSWDVFDAPFTEYRVDSRLLVIRRAGSQPPIADKYYFIFENEQFRQIALIRGRK
jgi:hypothetical protein